MSTPSAQPTQSSESVWNISNEYKLGYSASYCGQSGQDFQDCESTGTETLDYINAVERTVIAHGFNFNKHFPHWTSCFSPTPLLIYCLYCWHCHGSHSQDQLLV